MTKFVVHKSPSLQQKIDSLTEDLDEDAEELLTSIARTLVSFSPVDTGSYVNSHAVSAGGAISRSIPSDNKPRNQSVDGERQSAMTQLLNDIRRIDLKGTTRIVFSNAAPHSNKVENGWPTRGGYAVYARVRNIFG